MALISSPPCGVGRFTYVLRAWKSSLSALSRAASAVRFTAASDWIFWVPSMPETMVFQVCSSVSILMELEEASCAVSLVWSAVFFAF